MYDDIRQYMTRPDAIGFWVECDGNELTAKKKVGNIWEVECHYWNDKKRIMLIPATEVVGVVKQITQDDPYAVYSLFEKPTCWSQYQIQEFMDELTTNMCREEFGGFTLSADGVSTYTVNHNPQAFVVWRINGKESDFFQVIQTTQKKLEENVFWSYTEI